MEKKDLVEGMRLYIYKLRVDGRYSTAKSYLDALRSFKCFCGSRKFFAPIRTVRRRPFPPYDGTAVSSGSNRF